MKKISLILLLIALNACQSTKAAKTNASLQDLDVNLVSRHDKSKKLSATDKNSVDANSNTAESSDKNGDANTRSVTISAVMKWQQFFKPIPNIDQRGELAKKVEKWENTKSPEELVHRGQNETALGRLTAAEVSFREALRRAPDNQDAALELANIYLRRRDTTKTFEMLSQVRQSIALNPETPSSFLMRYRYTLALSYIARGDRDQGHKILSDLIGLAKDFSPGYVALASSYLGMGKDAVAEFIIKRGLDRGADDAGLYNLLGIIAEKRQDFLGARNYYNRALELSSTYAPALVNRASLSIKEMELGPAEEDLVRALLYAPTSVEAEVALGIVQRRTGRYEAAQVSLKRAIELDPDSAVARFNLAVLMASDLKKPSVAMRLFNEVLQTSSVPPDLREHAKTYLSDLRTEPNAM